MLPRRALTTMPLNSWSPTRTSLERSTSSLARSVRRPCSPSWMPKGSQISSTSTISSGTLPAKTMDPKRSRSSLLNSPIIKCLEPWLLSRQFPCPNISLWRRSTESQRSTLWNFAPVAIDSWSPSSSTSTSRESPTSWPSLQSEATSWVTLNTSCKLLVSQIRLVLASQRAERNTSSDSSPRVSSICMTTTSFTGTLNSWTFSFLVRRQTVDSQSR